MDENYLDSLLNEFSLDNQINEDIATEAPRQNTQVELKADTFDNLVSQDSDTRLSADDDIFGESQFDELDALDQMADMDMSDLDFSDLDFDDLDMLETSPKPERQANYSASSAADTAADNINAGAAGIDSDDLSIDGMFFEQPADAESTNIAQASTVDINMSQEGVPMEDINMSQEGVPMEDINMSQTDELNTAALSADAQSADMPQMSADMDMSEASLDGVDMFAESEPAEAEAGGSGNTDIND
ncbi:MAG: hypothetical protein K2G89_01370, partial [Lachnospiraceae bacterium]|nr:hypothetical protein [Lachnospiraceae bacterium]